MYVDPSDNTLKSYWYFTSIKHDFRDQIRKGIVKPLTYQQATELARGNTDKKWYIWIPEEKPQDVPLPQTVEWKDRKKLTQELWYGLISSFNALNTQKDVKDAVNNLLVDQNFNLVLDSGESLTSFVFKGNTLENRQTGIHEITQFEVQWKTLIITLKNTKKLIFTPPQG